MLFINYFLNYMFILYDIKTQMDALSAYNKLNLMRDVGFYKTNKDYIMHIVYFSA